MKPEGADMDIEAEKPGRKKAGAAKKRNDIGGSFEIISEDKMDEENDESSAEEHDLQEQLLEEFNDPQAFIKRIQDNSIRFKSQLFDKDKFHNCSIYTILLACIVFGRRVTQVSEDLTDPTTIDNLIEFSRFIPIPLTTSMKQLHTKVVISKALDVMLELELENCMPHSSYQKSLKQFMEETHEMNQASLKLCPHLCKLYQHENCLISTDTYNRFEIYKKQLDILVSTYKYFAGDGNKSSKSKSGKVSVSKLEVLYADAKHVSGIEEYHEFEFLKDEFQAVRKDEKGDMIDEEEEETTTKNKTRGRGSKRSKSPNPKDSPRKTRGNKMDIEKEEELSGSEQEEKKASSKRSSKKATPAKASAKKDAEATKLKEYDEDELNRKLEQLRSKMTLEQAEQRLEELQEDADEHEEEIADLKKKIKDTKDWLYYYKEAIIIENKNLSGVGDLIEDLSDIGVRVEEMELLLERVIRYLVWKKKFKAAVDTMRKAWRTPGKDMEIEAKLRIGQKDQDHDKLSLEELQQVLADANDLDLDKDEELQLKELKYKAIQARNLQDKITENLPAIFDVKTLTKLRK